MNELLALENKYSRLHFHNYFDPHRFINDFESITAQYEELGTSFNDEMLVAHMMNKLDSRNKPETPYGIFCSIILSLNPLVCTYEFAVVTGHKNSIDLFRETCT